MRSKDTRLEIPESRYLRSGQFAELCRTTKETLRHYRNIGLIEPVFISDNGYAYYSPLQLGDFMLVTALQRAGSSLADIRRYMEDPQMSELESMISEHIGRLESERRMLRAQQRFLQKTLDRSRALSEWLTVEDGWRIIEKTEERLFEIDISDLFVEEDANAEQGQDLVNEMIDIGNSLIERGLASRMQGGYRVGLESLLDGHPERDFHLCVDSTPSGRRYARHAKPAGRYFQRLRCASIDELLVSEGSLFAAYLELVEEVRRRGFVPTGDLYEQELSLYTGDIAAKAYTELSIGISSF